MEYQIFAKNLILEQSRALSEFAEQIPIDLFAFANYIANIDGKVIVTGVGKSGHIGRKISASLASTGTPSFFLHAGEAGHGDLGMIEAKDTILAISNSGQTQELYEVIKYCKAINVKIAAITMNPDSYLAKNSTYLLYLPKFNELEKLQAPTISSLLTLSLGDALVMMMYKIKNFSEEKFATYHPAGKIGENLRNKS